MNTRMYFFFLAVILLQISSLTAAHLRILPDKRVQNKFVGEAFFVGCESSGRNVQRVMWTGPDGNQITNYLDRIHVEDGKLGHKGVDLVFENITRKDRGNYTCSANVDGVEVQKAFELRVYKNIEFVNSPKVQYLDEHSDSVVRCNVNGDPLPKISWRKPNKKTIRFEDEGKFMRHPENPHWLVFKNATLKDAGIYKCLAVQLSDDISDFQALDIDVRVRHKPLGAPEHVNESYSYVTGVVNLTCEVIAEPSANFTWLKDRALIKPSENVNIFNEDQRSVLQLKVVNADMFGDYICKAQNRLGTLERVVSLQQGVKPPVPRTKIKHIKVNEFRLNLTSESHPAMPILAYKVEYKRPGEEWRQASIREFKYGGPYILDGLHSDTLYVMRVASKNIAGYSDYSKDMMERTKKASPVNQQLSGSSSPTPSFLALFIVLLTSNSVSDLAKWQFIS